MSSDTDNTHAAWGRWQVKLNSSYGTWRGYVRHALAACEHLVGRHSVWTSPPATSTRRLVFVCLGNINRSAFGEAVARALALPTVSLGLSTTTGAHATEMACRQARRQGFDLTRHRATNLEDFKVEANDLFLVMELRHARQLVARGIPSDAIRMLGHWARPARLHLHDPHTLSAAYFETCFTLIESAVRNFAAAFPGLAAGGDVVAARP